MNQRGWLSKADQDQELKPRQYALGCAFQDIRRRTRQRPSQKNDKPMVSSVHTPPPLLAFGDDLVIDY